MKLTGKSRKGILSFNFVSMIPRFIFLVIMLVSVATLFNLFLNEKFQIKDIQAEVFVSGLIYGHGGIGYYDALTGRYYPEIIDLDQLEGSSLDQAFYREDNYLIAAKIEVSKVRNPGSNTGIKKVVFFNKEWYDNWKPFLKLRLPGIGGIHEYKKTLPVMYRDEGILRSGYVHFQILQPRG